MAWTERYVRADAAGGGDGTTDTNSGANGAWTMAEAITNAAAGMRINVKAGTYNSSTDFDLPAGSISGTIWWRGFNSSIGDLASANVSTNFPHFNFSSNAYLTLNGYIIFSNFKVTSVTATAGRGVIWINGPRCFVHRNVFIYNGSTISECGVRISGAADFSQIVENWIESTYAVSYLCMQPTNAHCGWVKNYIKGGVNGIYLVRPLMVYGNIITGQSGSGIVADSNLTSAPILHNTFYDIAGNGFTLGGGVTGGSYLIAGNIFHTIGGDAIATGTAASCILADRNVYYSITGNQIDTQFLEQQQFNTVTASSSPLVDPANGDFRPQGDAIGVGVGNTFLGFPSLVGYRSAGAIQLGV